MAALLSCTDLHKSVGGRVLFDGLSLTLVKGDRAGLIGPNGSGKTTLLEILAGRETADSGTSALRKTERLAYVPQDSVFEAGDTVTSVLTAALSGVVHDEEEKRVTVQITLGRCGFADPEAPAVELSGGWKKRLAIAAALAAEPDVLLLDEPTNHLDFDGILWLEQAVLSATACLVVTHDRYFLENVSNRIIEINPAYPQGNFGVKGNYSKFLERREVFLNAESKHQEALENKVQREIEWLRRGPKARAGKSRSRIDAAGRLIDELDTANGRELKGSTRISFTASERKTKRLIDAEGLSKAFGDNKLFENVGLVLSPGVRVGLVGSNGSGKTTLLKILQGQIEPDAGVVKRANSLQVVNFAQDRAAEIDPDVTLRRTLCPEGDAVVFQGQTVHVVGWAKRFLFRPEQLEMPMSRLSGGEKARVLIARLMLRSADVLFLDEPTNDLDIPTLEVLEQNLMEFRGAVVLISHDRYLLDRVATVVIGLGNESETGVFADYSQWQAARVEPVVEKVATKVTASQSTVSSPVKKKLSYLEQREFDGMEAGILTAEVELEKWHLAVESAATNAERLQEACDKQQASQARVDQLYARWAELEAKLE
jgi:ATP-binding cassette subfamily F protein uup